jgi:hypothetical protein
MGTLDRIGHYRLRRDRAISGLFNCLPWPFQRFRAFIPGTEKAKYIICTANQKVGKSKFVDYVYVYQTILFVMQHPEIRARILYFTLEISPNSKKDEFLSFLLGYLDNIYISPTDLNSVDSAKPVPEEILALLASEKYKPYIDKYDEIVTYIDDIRNPTGINKYCRDYALSHGHINYTDETYTDSNGRVCRIINKDNPYTADDEEEIRIVIVDNASNFTQESGLSKMDTINKASKYFITLRDQLLYTIVLVQHQAQSQEGIENRKLGLIKPSSDGLADCKTTTRDADLVLGLYSPFKYEVKTHEGYDITKFRNYIRFMQVLEDRAYGASGQVCPLFFNGASSMFMELPKPDSPDLQQAIKFADYLEAQRTASTKKENKIFFRYVIKNLKKIKNLWQMS